MAATRRIKIGTGAAVGITTITALFFLLSSMYGLVITGDDSLCKAGACVSHINVYNPNNYDVAITNPNGLKLDFSPTVKSYELFIKNTKGEWVPLDFSQQTNKTIVNFRKKTTTELLLKGFKIHPEDRVKWGFTASKNGFESGNLDPVWDVGEFKEEIPIVKNDEEVAYFNSKFSNKSGVLVSTNPNVRCHFGSPADPYKYCETVFSVENLKSVKAKISSPSLVALFKNPTTRNVNYEYSNTSITMNAFYDNFTGTDKSGEGVYDRFAYPVKSYSSFTTVPTMINTAVPFAIKIKYKDFKYSENQFNFTVSAAGFTATIDPTQSGCGDLGWNDGAAITLTQAVTSANTCFNIVNSSVILDCQGYRVDFGTSTTNLVYGVNVTGYSNVTIRNCRIYNDNFGAGVLSAPMNFENGQNNTVTNSTLSHISASASGIRIQNASYSNVLSSNISVRGGNSGVIRVDPSSAGVLIRNNTLTRHNLTEDAGNTNAVLRINGNSTIIRGNNITANCHACHAIGVGDGNINIVDVVIDSNNIFMNGRVEGGGIKIRSNGQGGTADGRSANRTLILNNNITVNFTDTGLWVMNDTNQLYGVLTTQDLVFNNTFGELKWTSPTFLANISLVPMTSAFGLGSSFWILNRTISVNSSAFPAGGSNITLSNVNMTLRGLNFTNVTNIRRVNYVDTDYNNITTSSLSTDCTLAGGGCQIISYTSTTGNLIFNSTNVTGSFAANGSYASADACACPSPAANFAVDLALNCTISTSCNVTGFNITLSNSGNSAIGNFTINNFLYVDYIKNITRLATVYLRPSASVYIRQR